MSIEPATQPDHSVDSRRDLAAQISTVQQRHHELREKVRRRIIDGHVHGSWCREGIDRALEELDLDPYQPVHTVQATVTITGTVRNADDTHVAESWAHSALTVTSGDLDVDISGHDTVIDAVDLTDSA